MNFIKELLSEDSPLSDMRFMATYLCIFSTLLCVYGVYTGKDVFAYCELFAILAITGKGGQKIIEMKKNGDKPKS